MFVIRLNYYYEQFAAKYREIIDNPPLEHKSEGNRVSSHKQRKNDE